MAQASGLEEGAPKSIHITTGVRGSGCCSISWCRSSRERESLFPLGMDVFPSKKALRGHLTNNASSGCDSFACHLENRATDEILHANTMKLGLPYLVLFESFTLDILRSGIWVTGAGFSLLFHIIIDLD